MTELLDAGSLCDRITQLVMDPLAGERNGIERNDLTRARMVNRLIEANRPALTAHLRRLLDPPQFLYYACLSVLPLTARVIFSFFLEIEYYDDIAQLDLLMSMQLSVLNHVTHMGGIEHNRRMAKRACVDLLAMYGIRGGSTPYGWRHDLRRLMATTRRTLRDTDRPDFPTL